jgi:thiamine monophosphate synthase
MTPPRLLAITPPLGSIDPQVVAAWREAGALEGALAVLLREPGASPGSLVAREGRLGPLLAACEAAGVPVLLSCDTPVLCDAAALVSARGLAGLQLRGDPDEEALSSARGLLPQALLGRSCHGSPVPGRAALVDYTCFAPVFTPRTQPPGGRKRAAGLEALRLWTADPADWVVALGGIGPDNADACVRAGARGLAGISLFFGARERVVEDVAALVRGL